MTAWDTPQTLPIAGQFRLIHLLYSTGRRGHQGRRTFVRNVLPADVSDLVSNSDYVNPGVLPHRMLSDVECAETAHLLGDRDRLWSKGAGWVVAGICHSMAGLWHRGLVSEGSLRRLGGKACQAAPLPA